MRKLLAIEHVPMALKNRLMPVVEEVAKELGREFE
jgi:diadenosine tetraphosphate (Ap4A) HIT family hydrolase